MIPAAFEENMRAFLGRDANEFLKKANKASEITEDELKEQQTKVQKETDKYVKKVDEAIDKKSKEILTV